MGLIYLAMFFATAITNLASPAPASNQPMTAQANKDCSYEAVSSTSPQISTTGLKTDLSPDNPWYTKSSRRPANYGTYFASKEWVLVKRDAPIPSYKVFDGGENKSMVNREMDVLGKVNENGEQKWAFVATGHCDKQDFSATGNCVDPMTTGIIFVLQAKGRDSCNPFPGDPTPMPGCQTYPFITAPQSPLYPEYWIFNVYVLKEMLVYNHQNSYGGSSNEDFSSDDLPCWLTQCVGGDLRQKINPSNFIKWNLPCQKGTPPPSVYLSGTPSPTPFSTPGLGTPLSPGEAYPPSFLKNDGNWLIKDPSVIIESGWGISDFVWFAGKTAEAGAVSYGKTSKLRLGREEVEFNVSLKKLGTAAFNDVGVILEYKGIYYLYLPTNFIEVQNQGQNLKLRTFKPSPGFVYDWWYPSCKPAIYLYPEKETLFNVSLKPFGILTKSDPAYPFFTGWKGVKAKPGGQLTYKGSQYDYLYYEGRVLFVKTPQSGFVIRGDELSAFFDAVLPDLGLNNKEASDFKEYWLGRLNDPKAFYQASILLQEEIERLEGMSVSPKPDTLIRLRFVFKKLNNWELLPLPMLPETVQRKGITVVDWGGFYK